MEKEKPGEGVMQPVSRSSVNSIEKKKTNFKFLEQSKICIFSVQKMEKMKDSFTLTM